MLSGYYRCIWPGGHAKRAGINIDMGAAPHVATEQAIQRGLTVDELMPMLMLDEIRQKGINLAIFQRPMLYAYPQLFTALQQHGVTVVVDVDDLFTEDIPHGNPAKKLSSTKAAPTKNRANLLTALRYADLVTVSTPKLAEVYQKETGHDRYRVVRNRVHPQYLNVNPAKPSEIDGRMRIIWTGVQQYHPRDLQVTRGVVDTVCKKTDSQFITVGGSPEVANAANADVFVMPWLPLNGWDYPTEIAACDIGIVPLEINTFNQAKSNIKGLEYSSLGLPFIASPTDEYNWLWDKGVGELARSPRQWTNLLMRFINDPAYRRQRGEEGREFCRQWSFEQAVSEWSDAWESAFRIRQMRGTQTYAA